MNQPLILIDMSQILFANIFQAKVSKIGLELDYIRHVTLRSILFYKKKFNSSNIVLAFDTRSSWRYQYFPHYKGTRKQARAEDKNNDFQVIFDIINTLKEEFKAELPFIGIEVENAEGDDIIATLAKRFHKETQVWVVSGDHDFQQLQKYPNVQQFLTVKKKNAAQIDPMNYLISHIIKGEPSKTGDGIPNILSDDDSLINKVRQTPISAHRYEEIHSKIVGHLDNPNLYGNVLRNYHRNRTLVDFDCIPVGISINILQEYEKQGTIPKLSLHEYFFKHNLKTLYGKNNVDQK